MKTRQEYLDFQAETIEKATALYNKTINYAPRVFTRGIYTDYLVFMARWNHFSMPNSLLLFLQKPDASCVCSFKTWKALAQEQGLPPDHMILSKEERKKGIALLLPFSFNKITPADRYLTYKRILVFDVSQVNQIVPQKLFQPAQVMRKLDASAHLDIYRNAFEEESVQFVIGSPDDPYFQYQSAYSRRMRTAQEQHNQDTWVYIAPQEQTTDTSACILQEIIRYMAGEMRIEDEDRDFVIQSVTYAVCRYLELPPPLIDFPCIEQYEVREAKALFDLLHQICHLTQQVIYKLHCGCEKAEGRLYDSEDVRQLLHQYQN